MDSNNPPEISPNTKTTSSLHYVCSLVKNKLDLPHPTDNHLPSYWILRLLIILASKAPRIFQFKSSLDSYTLEDADDESK